MHKKLIYYNDSLGVDRTVAVPVLDIKDNPNPVMGMSDPQGASFIHRRPKDLPNYSNEIVDKYFGWGPDHI